MKLLNSTARASSAVLAGALLLGSLTACGGGSSQATAQVGTSTLTLAIDSDSASFGFDPLRVSAAQRQFFEGLYESLMTLQPDGSTKIKARDRVVMFAMAGNVRNVEQMFRVSLEFF